MSEIEQSAPVGTIASAGIEDRERLFATLYAELHRIAERELRRSPAATLSPTTLLHETFLSISRNEGATFSGRAQFFVYAGRAMRGLLIDYLRGRKAQKRGGLFEITSLPTEVPGMIAEYLEMERLGEALDSLAQIEARLAECVDLKYFCGFSNADIAQLWSVSERTVQREWEKARILLHRFLTDQAET
jgi:RNA polymerase sigma factor (TIGR02999 family)